MNVLNLDTFDIDEIRHEITTKYGVPSSMIEHWNDDRLAGFALGERFGIGSILSIEHGFDVTIKVDSNVSLSKTSLMLLMELEIIHEGNTHSFACLECEDDCMPREYQTDVMESVSWINVIYRK